MINASRLIGSHDVLFGTLDTLRYDVARDALAAGRTPHLAAVLPGGHWEERHSPASFTYAAHHAFFAGFLPAPVTPGRQPRLFAARFPGSLYMGIDLLISPDYRSHAILEVNAFGDLLPGVLSRGVDTYTAEVLALCGDEQAAGEGVPAR